MISIENDRIAIDIANYSKANALQQVIALTYVVKKLEKDIAELRPSANDIYKELSKDVDGAITVEVNSEIGARLTKNSAGAMWIFPPEITEKEKELNEAKAKAKEDKTATNHRGTLNPKTDALFKVQLHKETPVVKVDFSKYETA